MGCFHGNTKTKNKNIKESNVFKWWVASNLEADWKEIYAVIWIGAV